MAAQKLDQLNPPVEVQGISDQSEEEPNSPQNDQNIEFRLRNLVETTWANRHIRLLAWSGKSWYMWPQEK